MHSCSHFRVETAGRTRRDSHSGPHCRPRATADAGQRPATPHRPHHSVARRVENRLKFITGARACLQRRATLRVCSARPARMARGRSGRPGCRRPTRVPGAPTTTSGAAAPAAGRNLGPAAAGPPGRGGCRPTLPGRAGPAGAAGRGTLQRHGRGRPRRRPQRLAGDTGARRGTGRRAVRGRGRGAGLPRRTGAPWPAPAPGRRSARRARARAWSPAARRPAPVPPAPPHGPPCAGGASFTVTLSWERPLFVLKTAAAAGVAASVVSVTPAP